MSIRWTEPAANDLTAICDFIERHNGPSVGHRLALSIYDRISGLADFPEMGRVGRQPATRELVLTNLPYVVIYRVRGDDVEILRVLHSAQRWP
jgi:addiction module RelE/StbE family toxin